jgi:hypothetical protein
MEGVYIGARTLLDIDLIWFGNIARLSQRKEDVFYSFKIFLPAFAALRGRGGGQHHVV